MFIASNVLTTDFNQQPLDNLWRLISPLYCVDEADWLQQLIPLATPSEQELAQMTKQANRLIVNVRNDKNSMQMIDALLLEYSLDTQEGILLMCLSEALMRIPDRATANALIRDKLSVADWKSHLKNSDSVFVNASTWGLLLTGKVVGLSTNKPPSVSQAVSRLTNKLTEPVILTAMQQAMKIMGHQFVLGRSIQEAQKNATPLQKKGCTHSFDMLGEAALTQDDANKYAQEYLQAIEFIGSQQVSGHGISQSSSVSIKLSALHPRYEASNEVRVMSELYQQLETLLLKAKQLNVAITIDAEEADRLEISLKLFKKLYQSEALQGWGRFGLVVQAYSKRALPVLAWINRLASLQGDTIPVRLVKGAYWDSEIKWSQQAGYANYPVFTRKEATDSSYLACARYLLCEEVKGHIFPQFASHNAHTISAINAMATHQDYEFQRLHGMGESLYQYAMQAFQQPVRIYAPVGSHKELLPYLVRRLLENGANSSFVNRLFDARCSADSLTLHPVSILDQQPCLHNPYIPLPTEIFLPRKNSYGINIEIESELNPFQAKVEEYLQSQWIAGTIINGQSFYESMIKDESSVITIRSPHDQQHEVGKMIFSNLDHVSEAITQAHDYFPQWQKTPRSTRQDLLNDLADALEENLPELVALCHQEAGKTIHDCIDEVREAVDFCRYYSALTDDLVINNHAINNKLTSEVAYQGRGVFACISPWNFPLAIFLGQISAALVVGNTVVAKPAEQTSLIAAKVVDLMLKVGFPKGCIHLILGHGGDIGQQLTTHPLIAGVAFTGSTQTAQRININLASRECLPVPFIAETGGQNAMIVDSSALPEQVVNDVMRSAFASAGQRCSALRVLYIQDDIADRVIELISGALDQLNVGMPYEHSVDVGPVIDKTAQDKLQQHIDHMSSQYTQLAQVKLPEVCKNGHFIAPTVFEIPHINVLPEEKFGPILHVIRYGAEQLPEVVEQINASGYGLTMGIHSRNETTYRWIEENAKVGNCYINRDQVGAVVGVQPFGGQGLSGTGPKAGGPHYLYRFAQCQLITTTTMQESANV